MTGMAIQLRAGEDLPSRDRPFPRFPTATRPHARLGALPYPSCEEFM